MKKQTGVLTREALMTLYAERDAFEAENEELSSTLEDVRRLMHGLEVEHDKVRAGVARLRGLLKRTSRVMCGISSNAFGPLLEYVSPKFRAEFEALQDAINAEIYPEARAALEQEGE